MPGNSSAPVLSIEGIGKIYGSVTALKSIDLNVEPGEFLTILGPSGSGKTTLLRIIAGFETPDSGKLTIRGKDMTWASAAERQIGMVFQQYALFPHLTVLENVLFPLEMRRIPQRQALERALAALDSVRLADYSGRYPKQLSGGQQQRVALARAIVFEPSLLLLDEPFSALDRRLRESMQQEVKQLQASLKLTTIFITHDQDEALVMSDRIAVMDKGIIQQLGTPSEIYYHPTSITVARFVGESNIFDGSPEGDGFRTTSGTYFKLQYPTDHGRILVRPEAVHIDCEPAGSSSIATSPNMFEGRVLARTFIGGFTNYQVQLSQGDVLSVRSIAREGSIFEQGQAVKINVPCIDCRPLSGGETR